MRLIRGITQNFDSKSLVNRIVRGGCRVLLTDAPPQHLVVDLDKISLSTKKCDFLYVDQLEKNERIVPLELKKRVSSIREIVEQLQHGAELVCADTAQHDSFYFIPTLVFKGLDKAVRKELRKYKVSFAGKSYSITA